MNLSGASAIGCLETCEFVTILLADDADYIRALFRKFLSSVTDEILETNNGEGLLSLVRQSPPDLVLLDIHMPGPNVLELIRQFKASEATAGIPIILISGTEDPELLDDAFRAGADDFILKPPNFSQLRSRVQAYLALARLRKLEKELAYEREENAHLRSRLSNET